jgi:hypothetical protein
MTVRPRSSNVSIFIGSVWTLTLTPSLPVRSSSMPGTKYVATMPTKAVIAAAATFPGTVFRAFLI